MFFKDIIGQHSTTQHLCKALADERMAHAQMFLGPEGCGKLALALAYAQYILCENKQTHDSCGTCPSCSKAAKMIHPDIHFSYPSIGSKSISQHFLTEWRATILEQPYLNANQWLQAIGAENKQGNITKDECVNIVKKLSLKSFEGKHKILIMWLPEYLGKEGNRLLKLIEEPPDDTVFIFVAENQEMILNTILSRCQILKISPLSDETIAEGLMAKFSFDQEKALSVARLSNGNFNEALSLVNVAENDNADLFLDWLRKCWKGNGVELVKWVEKFAKLGRENQKQFLQYSLHFLRECMFLKMTGNSEIRLQAKEKDTADKLQKVLTIDKINDMMQLFNDCSFHVERNANPKILFLDASIRMHKIIKQPVLAQ